MDRSGAWLAAAMACLLAIKGLALAASSTTPGLDREGAARAAVACIVGGDDHGPADDRNDASPCCFLCGAGARDRSADDGPAPMFAPLPWAGAASPIVLDRGIGARHGPRRGAAWSPRAPPRV